MRVDHEGLSIEQIKERLDEEIESISKREAKKEKQKKIHKQTKRIMKK